MNRIATAVVVYLAIHASYCYATPLHGLNAVFQAQTPQAYQQRLTGIADKIETREVRAGTVDDLKQITDAARRRQERGAGENADEDGDGAGSRIRRNEPAGKEAAAHPSLITRDLGGVRAKSFDNAPAPVNADILAARMQALELVEVLAYFNAENVNWDGHMGQDCDYPGFREAAMKGLKSFGNVGAEAVVQGLGQELTAVTIPREVTANPNGYVGTYNGVYRGQVGNPLTRDRRPIANTAGMTPEQIVQQTLLLNPTYHDDLIDLIAFYDSEGMLTDAMIDHLKACASGKKDPELQEFAKRVLDVLNSASGGEGMSQLTAAELLRRLGEESDPRRKTALDSELQRRQDEGSILDLLELLAASDGGVRNTTAQAIAARDPKYSEVRPDLLAIWNLTNSTDEEVARAARGQIDNAFQRAPVSHCIYWIGQQDETLARVIWEHVDARIARADAERRAEYVKYAVQMATYREATIPMRLAALEVTAKLRDLGAARELAKSLPELPPEVRVACGRTLKAITGQEFGPRSDTAVDAFESAKRWERWLESKSGK